MKKTRSGILQSFALALSLAASNASAQTYPTQPIRIVIGFTAGSGPDTAGRIVAPRLSELMGQPVLVENRGGAGGSIATGLVAKAAPDGYTLMMLSASDTLQSALRPDLAYDLERDFAPVSLLITAGFPLVVNPSLPVRNVQELISLAKAHPGKLNYGSSGVGSSAHLAGELFKLMAKADIQHVPYKGTAESGTATVAGHIEMSFSSIAAAKALAESGKIRVLAITSIVRSPAMPSVPTISESGLQGYDRSVWYGIAAPRGTSKDVIARLNAAFTTVTSMPAVAEALTRVGLYPKVLTPDEFGAFIKAQVVQNSQLVKAIGLKAE